MSDIQHTQTEPEMRESEILSQFATWIERVTEPASYADYQPRHRADTDAR